VFDNLVCLPKELRLKPSIETLSRKAEYPALGITQFLFDAFLFSLDLHSVGMIAGSNPTLDRRQDGLLPAESFLIQYIHQPPWDPCQA
jgi:hypothetical protein